MFQDYVQIRAPIKTAGGTIYAVGKGTVGHIQNCLHVPTMDVNLISTSQVTGSGVSHKGSTVCG